MENWLRQCKRVFIYLDDILVYNLSEKEHNQNLTNLIRRLQKVVPTVNTEKCKYRTIEIKISRHQSAKCWLHQAYPGQSVRDPRIL